jgi:alkylated DNA nucleotide flippase Atl1
MKETKTSWDSVFRFVKSIPRGRVITYGELARALRLRGGARTAGHAMAATPRGRGIPWHRVVGAGGRLLPREPYGSAVHRGARRLEAPRLEEAARREDRGSLGASECAIDSFSSWPLQSSKSRI